MRKSILVTIAMILSSCQMNTSDDFLVIGHRGAMGYVTENTIASVEKAIDLGVSMVEIDVFRIRSGEVVVFHDDRVDDLTMGLENRDLYMPECWP